MTQRKHVVCYSGGHSSALVAIEVARRYQGDGEIVLLNHNINASVEDADIKRFKREVANYLGLRITYANYAQWETEDQFDVAVKNSAFKVGSTDVLCTSRLKTEPFKKWLSDHTKPGDGTVVYYGFDAGERARVQRRASIMAGMGYRTDYPLALWPREDRTIFSTREVGIEPPMSYGTFKHANCIGCIKAGKQHWYAVYCLRPDIWEKAKRAEESIGYSIMRNDYLEELEADFSAMRKAGIEPTERVHANTFWANTRKRLKVLHVTEEDVQTDAKPCECVF